MAGDDNRLESSYSDHCNTVQDTQCPAATARVIAAVQQWLDDLNRSQPPPRFATIDGQMRRHLAADLSYLHALVAANQAKNQTDEDRKHQDVRNERDWVNSVTTSVANSNQKTVAIYTGLVRLGKADLDACAGCQRLAGQSQASCVGNAVSTCDSVVAETAAQIAAFQSALVQSVAPDALSAKDALLQTDLAKADTALIAMADALLADDQAGFNRGRTSFQQAIVAVNADASALLNSSARPDSRLRLTVSLTA